MGHMSNLCFTGLMLVHVNPSMLLLRQVTQEPSLPALSPHFQAWLQASSPSTGSFAWWPPQNLSFQLHAHIPGLTPGAKLLHQLSLVRPPRTRPTGAILTFPGLVPVIQCLHWPSLRQATPDSRQQTKEVHMSRPHCRNMNDMNCKGSMPSPKPISPKEMFANKNYPGYPQDTEFKE